MIHTYTKTTSLNSDDARGDAPAQSARPKDRKISRSVRTELKALAQEVPEEFRVRIEWAIRELEGIR